MRRFFSVVKGGRKAGQESDLLKILQSEINHELTSNRYQYHESCSIGDFVPEWDSPRTQDVLLRKKCESGEEVSVSALLGEENHKGGGDDEITRVVLMKVCVKKPGLSSILQFDCEASSTGVGKSGFNILNSQYIPSPSTFSSSTYGGPLFRQKIFAVPFFHFFPEQDLDLELQDELKRYLEARGIGESLTNFLILHLHKKEPNQYVNWLQTLKTMVAKKE